MRITNKKISNTYSKYLNQNLASLQEVEEQLISGKLYNRPSQNPYATTRVMGYESEIRRFEQYERNVRDVEAVMNVADGALGQVNDMLKRVRELAMQAANGTLDQNQREIIATEIDEILETMVSTFNSSLDNQYIFGGTVTDKAPFEIVTPATGGKMVVYHGNGDNQKVEVSPNLYVNKYITGDRFMQQVNGRDIFNGIIDLSKAMRDNDTTKINELTEDLIAFEDIILDARGVAGATQNRMEMTADKIAEEIQTTTELLSNYGDTDYSLKIVEYKSMSAIYQASLQISANIIKPTLMDFLK